MLLGVIYPTLQYIQISALGLQGQYLALLLGQCLLQIIQALLGIIGRTVVPVV